MSARPPGSARLLLAVAGLTGICLPGLGQTVPVGQQQGLPSGLQSTLPPALLVPQGSPLDRDRPFQQIPTAPGLPDQALPPAAPFAPNLTARIGTAVVVGSTIYPAGDLTALTRGLAGVATPLSKVEEVRQALLARYRQDGYLLTTVSSAIDRNGSLTFTVVEGYIADVRLQGDIGPAGTQVLRFLHRITEERPVRIATLERYLLLANDIPGVTLRSVLRPSSEDPAAVTLIAQVSRKAFDGVLSADNRAFRQTGPEQLLAVAGANSFTQFGERTEISLLHSFNNTETFGQVTNEFFVGGSGAKIRLFFGEGGTNPSGNLRELGYDGRTRVFGVQGSYPIIRSREQSLFAILSLDAIESDIRTDSGSSGQAARASFDSLRILRAGLDYALQDTVAGLDRPGTTNVSVRLSQGLPSLGATRTGDPQAGQQGSRTDFFKMNAEISRSQMLFRPFDNATVTLFGLVAGQVSDSVLPPEEKFFLGGIRYNRGFYSGEVTGDNALTTAVELQLNLSFPVTVFDFTAPVSSQFYIFHDYGETFGNQSSDLNVNHNLHSAGAGSRTQITSNVSLEVEGVHRFTRNTQSSGNAAVSSLKGDAAYWRVVTRF